MRPLTHLLGTNPGPRAGDLPERRGAVEMRLIASVLAGSWRSSPPAISLSPNELTRIAPQLLALRVGALGWWTLRHSPLQDHPAMPALRDAFRHTRVHHALMERELADGVRALAGAGIDPLLGKGWLAARCYADPGLRPFSDIDLSLPAEQCATGTEVLKGASLRYRDYDLQPGFHSFIDRSHAELEVRAEQVLINGVPVRVLGPEDHIRLLCYHLLSDGVPTPLALVDVAACLESLPDTFDWKYCLSGRARRTEYVRLALSLAARLTGASVDRVPEPLRPPPPPEWVETAVLGVWQRGAAHPEGIGRLSEHLVHGTLLTGLRLRWPSALQVAVRYEAKIGDRPRAYWQIRDWIDRGMLYVPQEARAWLDRYRTRRGSVAGQ